MNRSDEDACRPRNSAPDLTTKLLLAVIAAALSAIALRSLLGPLLAPSIAVAAPGDGGGTAPVSIAAASSANAGSPTAFVVSNGKVTVIEQVYNHKTSRSEWKAVGVVPLAK